MIYLTVLTLHNLMRWITLIAGLWAIYRAYRGWWGRRPWTPEDRHAGQWFATALTIQFFIGGLFYCLPGSMAQMLIFDPGTVLRVPPLRFIVLEHAVQMVVALGLAHAGVALAPRATRHIGRHRRAALLFSLAFGITLIAIPWPFLDYGRPWLRLWGG
ncbi:MAG: hypothetical protein RMK84_05980 [Oscillochloridaceae bacterium]|nr:hypothetical protein [Chloroflexaceae bacterium]MDW8389654.1 hypothetical protein [Oscillochloridaceae bacterium]